MNTSLLQEVVRLGISPKTVRSLSRAGVVYIFELTVLSREDLLWFGVPRLQVVEIAHAFQEKFGFDCTADQNHFDLPVFVRDQLIQRVARKRGRRILQR